MLQSSSFTSYTREEVLSALRSSTLLAADTETISVEDPELLCIALAISSDTSFCFSPDDKDIGVVWEVLERVPSIWHNAAFDILNLEREGHRVNWVEDTMLLAKACGLPAALGDLSYEVDFEWESITSLLYDDNGKKIKKKTLKMCPFEDLAKLCNLHSQGTFKTWLYLDSRSHNSSYVLDKQVLKEVGLAMMKRGIRLDKKLVATRCGIYQKITKGLKEKCLELGFNPASPSSIGVALSEKGIITDFTPKGSIKTGEEALLTLKDTEEVAFLTLAYRERAKLYSTYFKPFLGLERVYPKYHIVRTGRFGCTKPNIQNQPKSIRDQYIPDEGEFFWDADLHQIEPTIMAWLSGDKQMQEDVATGDIYQPIANRFKVKRYTCKQLVLACSYGAGEEQLVETSQHHGDHLTLDKAHTLLTEYYKTYHGYRDWKKQKEKEAKANGYIETWLGRKRTLKSMAEGEEIGYNPLLKAVNSIVQGTAAEILKISMVALRGYKQVACIHDENLLSTALFPDMHLFDGLFPIDVKWDVKVGENWRDLKAVVV